MVESSMMPATVISPMASTTSQHLLHQDNGCGYVENTLVNGSRHGDTVMGVLFVQVDPDDWLKVQMSQE